MSLINGLPAHVLLIHAVVVLLPLAALATVAVAWSARLRRKLGVTVPVLALVAAAFVPLATNAGEWLQGHVPPSDLVQKHTQLGDQVLPWAAGLVAVAVIGWLLERYTQGRGAETGLDRGAVRIGFAVVATVVAVGCVVSVFQAGDSGARAAWLDQVSTTAPAGGAG